MKSQIHLEDFPLRSVEKIRFSDTDMLGHVNNMSFSAYFESARMDLLFNSANSLPDSGAIFVVAQISINFFKELTWPGEVEVGTKLNFVGSSSFKIFQGLFRDGQCVASAETVIVQMGLASRRSLAFSQKAHDFLVDQAATAMTSAEADQTAMAR